MISASGLYGLFRLDGAPVDPRDAAILGLPIDGQAASALAMGVDRTAPQSIHRHDAGNRITILVGDLDRVGDLADRLGLPRDIAPAHLATSALARFGAATPRELLGEWTLLQWEAGELTLMASAARRDQVFFGIAGARCAVTSDLFRIAQLPWIGRDLDEAGLLLSLGRADVRQHRGNATIVRKVRRLAPGACVTISAAGVIEQRCEMLVPQQRWRGTFADAMAEAEALLLEIIGERMRRGPAPALLLSGGLDSSLLAWAMAETSGTGQRLRLITSVAPPGSGLPDESSYADIVAEALGLRCEHVAPQSEAQSYRPSVSMMQGAHGAMLSNRLALTDAFQAAAKANGATMLVNGCYGEMHLTGSMPFATRWHKLIELRNLIRRYGKSVPIEPEPHDAFHVRLSDYRRGRLPETVIAALDAPPLPPHVGKSDDLWGYPPGIDKALEHPNEFYPGALRMDFPYRDVRLLRLFAGFPTGFFMRGSFDRAPVRHILKGRLPDSIRLRRGGMAASPDHMARLQRQAPAARARITAFRQAGLDEWFDLAWLDTALGEIAQRGPRNVDEANEVQMTTINAEYLTWWRTAA